jgi:ABC-type anion transport system duplicated permease subunit
MGIFGDVLIIPVNLTILITGLVLALGTPWGLLRYYWVVTKLVLTLGLATASIFGLRARIADAADNLSAIPEGARDVGTVGILLVVLLPIALGVYVTTTVLGIYKPWGRTHRGRRTQRTAPAG